MTPAPSPTSDASAPPHAAPADPGAAPATPLALVRVAVCAVLLADLALTFVHGVGWAPWVPAAAGGLAASPAPGFTRWGLGALLGPDLGGPVALLLATAGLLLGLVGVVPRPALLLAAVALQQLAFLDPTADRGVDPLLRLALLVCALAPATRLPLPARGRPRPTGPPFPTWPAEVLRAALVGLYLSAGVGKLVLALAWVLGGSPPVLARILADPTLSRLAPATALAHPTLASAAGLAVLAFELSAPLVWTRHGRAWALVGIAFHVGTAAILDLGVFPWGVLALYPVLLLPPPGRPRRPR